MIINKLFKIKSDFYRQERIRPKENSTSILPKQIKMTKNAQIVLLFTESSLSKNTILSGVNSLLEDWDLLFTSYSVFRIFYDDLPNNSIRFLISFNTLSRLSYDEGEIILKISLDTLEAFFKNIVDVDNNDVTFIDLMDKELDKQEQLLHSLLINTELMIQTSEKNTTSSSGILKKQLDNDIFLINENNQLQDTLEKANKEIQVLTALNKNIHKMSIDFQNTNDKTKEELNQQIKLNNTNITVISELRNSFDNMNKKIKIQYEEIDSNTKLIDSLQANLDDVNKEIKTKDELIDSHSTTMKELRANLDDANKENLSQIKINNKNVETINNLQSNLDDVNKEIKTKNELLDKSISSSILVRENSMKENSSLSLINEKELITTLKNISTDWEQIYHISESNYQQLKEQPTISKKFRYSTHGENESQIISSSLPNSKSNDEKNMLTQKELELLELFNNYGSSKYNSSISIDSKKYQHYMINLPFLSLTWQSIFQSGSKSRKKKFEQTFQPFIDELNSVLEDISLATKPKILNKKKVILSIDNLKLLKAYEALFEYISSI